MIRQMSGQVSRGSAGEYTNPYSYTDKASDFVQEASALQAPGTRQDADDASIPISHIDGRCHSPVLLGLLKSQPWWRVRDRQQNGSLKPRAEGRCPPLSLRQRSAPSGIGNPLVCSCSRKCVWGLTRCLIFVCAVFTLCQVLLRAPYRP